MTVEYEAHPERFLGTGTVFIAWDPHAEDPHYSAYWDSFPDHEPSMPLEDGPRTTSVEEAVAWGRQRTPRVLIRPELDPHEYYWAGADEPSGVDADLPRLAL
jgi:hypothetical protein